MLMNGAEQKLRRHHELFVVFGESRRIATSVGGGRSDRARRQYLELQGS
jgi:hypothetical protein